MGWGLYVRSLLRVRTAVFNRLLIMVLFAVTCGMAAASIQLTDVGRWGGMCSAVASANNRAYVGVGGSVVIYDVSDPASSVRIGAFSVPTPSRVASICVSGNYAYVLAYESGLYIVDISDPAAPAMLGSFSTSVYARNVAVSGNYAYIADWNGGLKIIRISDPAHPIQVGSYSSGGFCYGVAVSGNYAYLADSTGILSVNVSNPAAPYKAGARTDVYAFDVAIAGNRLYAACGYTNGFQIYDLSTPTSLVRLGLYDTPGDAQGVAVSGDYAYVGDSRSGLQVINISNPASPARVGTFDTPDSAGDLVVTGNHVLVADGWDGLRAINVSNPALPTESWACASGSINGIAVSGDTVYAACSVDNVFNANALSVLDAIDPARIAQVGSCAISGSGPIDLSGSLAWIAGSKGLNVVDVAVPASPSVVGALSSSVRPGDVALFGHYACTANGDSGIQIVDVANPRSPLVVGTYNTSGYAYAVEVSGGYAYVADGRSGLQIINLVNPASPTLAASYATSSDAYDIEIGGHYIYLGAAGLQILDITNPIAPTRVSSLNYVSTSFLTLSGNYLYASGTQGSNTQAAILDVSNPANPVLLGRTPIIGSASVSSDRIYTISGGILRVQQMAQSDQCIICGYVKDPSGNPVNGAVVTTAPGGYTATTNHLGRYELLYVNPASYTITASGSGWAPASTTLSVTNGQTVQAADMVFAFGGIAGCVKDDLGNPVSGATVSLSPTVSTTTDAEGNYTLANLVPGSYYVSFSKSGYVPASQTVSVQGGQTTTFNLSVTRTGSIAGYVKDNLGGPISRISVSTYPYGTGSDSTGAYLITDVPPGTYSVTASDPSWTSVTKGNVVVTAGGTTALDFTLQLGTISGTVKNASGGPVSGAVVSSANGNFSATTDSSGVFTITNVGPTYYESNRGPVYYTLTASKAGHQSSQNTVHVTGGKTTTINFVLTAYGTISGTITDAAGKPVSGAQVTASYSCQSYTATTDAQGHYRIQDALPANGATIVATKASYGTLAKTVNVIDCQDTICDFRLAYAIALSEVSRSLFAPGPCGIGVDNGVAFLACGASGLRAFDVSTPEDALMLSTYDTQGYAYELAIRGDYAFVADDTWGLQILSISNPLLPALAGSYDTPGSARAVDVVGDYAYVADGSAGLQIINIANPASPVRVGGYDTSGVAVAVDVNGSYAYVADANGGLQIINISNPASPLRVSQFSTLGCTYSDVAVSGNYAYVMDGYVGLFMVFDVSAPSSPRIVATGYTGGSAKPARVCLSGNYAYVASGYSTALVVYDISSPMDPNLVGRYTGCCGNDVAVSNGFIYIADNYGRLVVLAPSYVAVTKVAPNCGTNLETMVATKVTGLGFKEGATVKLTRTGCPDIQAVNVVVEVPGEITCSLNLTGAAPGLWDVVVTNTDGTSSTLPGSFSVRLADTSPVVTAANRSVRDSVTAAASSRWRFRFFGQVISRTADTFLIDDGSRNPIKVYAPGFTRVGLQDYVAVTGTLDVSSSPALLLAADTQIDILAPAGDNPPPPPGL